MCDLSPLTDLHIFGNDLKAVLSLGACLDIGQRLVNDEGAMKPAVGAPLGSCIEYKTPVDWEAPTGAYWITASGSQFKAFCDMDRHGGGWMLLLKATEGNTFGWHADHWTSPSILNEEDLTPNGNTDAKYPAFNQFEATAFLAVWPDFDNNEWCDVGLHLIRLACDDARAFA